MKENTRQLEGLKIGPIAPKEIEEALGVTSRGMRDNPINVAVFGEDAELRLRRVHNLFGEAAKMLEWERHMLVTRDADGAIVGVCGMMPPGDCLPNFWQQLRILPQLLRSGPRAAGRTLRWLGAWSKRDLEERHWHLGPVAVDAHLQGMGIGSQMMRAFCDLMDAAGEDAYLETDKPENVSFYERFGFEIVAEQEVLGTTSWFMFRRATGKA